MADVQAFRAFRYDLGRVGALSEVIAPPYDVIDPALQQTLYARNPHNVVRLILNQEEPTDTDSQNRYTRAASCLRDWVSSGVLKQDSARNVYVYHQDYEVEGRRHVRKGFLARVRLERFGEGKIFPHEETMAGPKADRLKLVQATAMNLSPVFGLYPDPEGSVQTALDRLVHRLPPLEATDHLGVVSRLWPVSDQHVVSTVTGLMGPKPIFIADGHHRYETGLGYLDEKRQAGDARDADVPASYILMMLVSMSDPGLLILPTHRLVTGLPDLTAEQMTAALGSHFHVENVGRGEQAARDVWEVIEADGGQDVLGFGTVADGKWLTARSRNAAAMAELARGHSVAWQSLAVSILHVHVLGHLLPKATIRNPECRYVHLLSEVLEAARQRSCQLACLIPPATMNHVEQIAGDLEKMPPKSTYFHPKLLSGLVFNSLKAH